MFTPDPRSTAEELRLLPAVSGYRDEETLRLEFTTEYYPAYELINTDPALGLEAADFEIVVPLDKLASVNLFLLDIDQGLFEILSIEANGAHQTSPQEESNSGLFTTLLWLLVAWTARR